MNKGKKRTERNQSSVLTHSCFVLPFLMLPAVRSLLDQPGMIEILGKSDPGDASVTDLVQQVRQIDPNLSTVRLLCHGTHWSYST